MNRIKILFILLAGIAFASTPLIIHAQQIVDPTCSDYSCLNDNFSTITVDTLGAYNSVIYYSYIDSNGNLIQGSYDYYVNYEDIGITSNGMLSNNMPLYSYGTLTNSGTLNNTPSALLYTSGTLTNIGTLTNSGTLTNIGTLTNYGTLNNNAGGYLDNSGTLNNYGTLNNDAT